MEFLIIFNEGPIFTAIRWDNPDVIPLLVQRGSEINGLNEEGQTPLAVAVSLDSRDLVKVLLDCGATREVSGVPEEKLDSITKSSGDSNDHPIPTKKTGVSKKNIRVAEDEKTSQLFDIVANNQVEELDKIIQQGGFDPNVRANYTNETLLHTATTYGSFECVKKLIQAGADVNAQTALYQESPIHIAIQEGYFEIFYILIRNGADIESSNCEGIYKY